MACFSQESDSKILKQMQKCSINHREIITKNYATNNLLLITASFFLTQAVNYNTREEYISFLTSSTRTCVHFPFLSKLISGSEG